jgi:excisionase family DNA binding protein
MTTFNQHNPPHPSEQTGPISVGPQQLKLMKAREVGNILGISISKAYALIASGDIPAVKIGRCVRVQPRDLMAYIDERTIR